MTEDAVRIDDRTFQDLVDEAKRLIPQVCPKWTNHGPTDPGIALIEVFAWMTDQLIRRLNTIPERVHEAFIRLTGIEPFPATVACVDVLVMTSGDFVAPLVIPKGAVFSTTKGESGDAIQFEAIDDASLWTPRITSWGTLSPAGKFVDLTAAGSSVDCFASNSPGEALALGLSRNCADHVLQVNVVSRGSLGMFDPSRPPLVWEAWCGDLFGWQRVEVISDTTGGLCSPGYVVVVVPIRHESTQIGEFTASWLRARLLAEGPPYAQLPQVESIAVTTVGGVVRARHCSTVVGELLGVSDGTPGQTFRTARSPVLPGPEEQHILAVESWQEWRRVADFSESGEFDLHYTIESATGEVRFGPLVSQADGAARQYGAVAPSGAQLRLSAYQVGGGSKGNVGAGTIDVMGTTVPFIGSVYNHHPAVGGSDAESIEGWKKRSRLALQTGGRAVTRADFERIALWSHPEIARAVCLESLDRGPVRVLVVPHVWSGSPATTLDEVAVGDDVLEAIAQAIDERRMVGTSVDVSTPAFVGVSVVARVRPRRYHMDVHVRDRCAEAVAKLLHPTIGGSAGDGWPFGRDVDELAIWSALSRVDGVEEVVEVLIFDADASSGARAGVGRRRLALADDSLPLLVRPWVVIDRSK